MVEHHKPVHVQELHRPNREKRLVSSGVLLFDVRSIADPGVNGDAWTLEVICTTEVKEIPFRVTER